MKKQANSSHCFVCGLHNDYGLHMKFYEDESGKVVSDITVPKRFQGYPGIVHGGIIAAMLDEVSGRTITNSEATRWMVTASISIRYRKPVPVEKLLHLEGSLKQDSGAVARVRGEIYDENGVLLAEADSVLAAIPPSLKASVENLPQEEWRVYPD
jgi:uncharacterized protein (TIGR00369 family)